MIDTNRSVLDWPTPYPPECRVRGGRVTKVARVERSGKFRSSFVNFKLVPVPSWSALESERINTSHRPSSIELRSSRLIMSWGNRARDESFQWIVRISRIRSNESMTMTGRRTLSYSGFVLLNSAILLNPIRRWIHALSKKQITQIIRIRGHGQEIDSHVNEFLK